MYVVLAIVFGRVDPIFRTPLPVWNPLQWNPAQFNYVFSHIVGADGDLRSGPAAHRWSIVVPGQRALPARSPTRSPTTPRGSPARRKGLILTLLIAPFWISYMMRMLAWVNLLQNDGLVNRGLSLGGLFHVNVDWLSGRSSTVVLGLVYGYVPYMILPLFAGLDRIQASVLEAARDLGAGRFSTFRRVTWRLSLPAVVASVLLSCLPMLGDYFTNDLLSASPRTSMVGNLINNSALAARADRPGRRVRAARAAGLAGADALVRPQLPRDDATAAALVRPGCARWWSSPWRPPRILAGLTIVYLLWSLLPVRRRGALLVQRRQVPHGLAGLLDALVLRRPDPVGLARPEPAHGADPHAGARACCRPS